MNPMHIFLIILALVSIAHITAIYNKKETIRYITKCFLVPLLLAAYIAGGGSRFFWVIPALVFGWLGDVMLIKKQKGIYFMLGLVSFLLGHICYIAAFFTILEKINIPAILIFAPPSAALAFVIFRLIKPTKEMYIPVILYMAVLVIMSFTGFQVFLFRPGVAGLLILSGSFNFMVSDTILAYYTFRKPKVYGSVLLMSFYILAQAEIVMGLFYINL